VLDLTHEHSTSLHQKYDHYFFTISTEKYGWIRNPFSANAEMSTQELSLPVRKNILELRNGRILKLKCSDVPLDEFWICIEEVYKRISKVAIEILQCFSTYLCEQSFSSLF